ncbi:tetratricopeptide repeat protein [Bradyrhizobium sp. Ec3.3]|uniref:tetratricopeptide repeat protein n=1 Tax=Bradyrhizobium sp. Ec3.3 TaxID=189753 RepID=UPI0003FEFA39|nr:tetratricopeptide repeat protein [Bradyrhizobium sp. Ec3.3]
MAYSNRGNAYQDKGDLDRAIADHSQALALDPKNAPAYNNRGNAYALKGDLDRAIADYNQAIAIDPKSAKPYNNRGRAYRDKGNLDRAIADYSQAITIDSKYANAYFSRGRLNLALGAPARPSPISPNTISLAPTMPTAPCGSRSPPGAAICRAAWSRQAG